jgi:hypothetical protein
MWAFLVGNRSSSLLNRSLLLVSASADWWDKCDVVRGLREETRKTLVSKETYYSVKGDLLQCQRRPNTVSKETYYSVKRDLYVRRRPRTACRDGIDVSVKRDLLQCQKRPIRATSSEDCMQRHERHETHVHVSRAHTHTQRNPHTRATHTHAHVSQAHMHTCGQERRAHAHAPWAAARNGYLHVSAARARGGEAIDKRDLL